MSGLPDWYDNWKTSPLWDDEQEPKKKQSTRGIMWNMIEQFGGIDEEEIDGNIIRIEE